MDFKEHIIEKIVDITGLEREVVEKSVEVPPDEKMGDIAFPCFPLAKVMRKAPPIIAQELAEKIKEIKPVDQKAILWMRSPFPETSLATPISTGITSAPAARAIAQTLV